jgi:hypothetical protein
MISSHWRRRLGAAIRARFSAAVIEAELAKGRATSLDKAVAYALEGVGDLQEPAGAAWAAPLPRGGIRPVVDRGAD